MPRLFVAVPIASADLRGRLSAAGRAATEGCDVKHVPEGQLHVTLKFLGDVDESRIAPATSALGEAALGIRAFVLAWRGLGVFPARGAPRVVWAGCDAGEAELRALADRVGEVCALAGFPRETRAFRPHLTLARVRERGAARDLVSRVSHASETPFGGEEVRALVLFRSVLGPDGARHTRLAESALGDVRPAGLGTIGAA